MLGLRLELVLELPIRTEATQSTYFFGLIVTEALVSSTLVKHAM